MTLNQLNYFVEVVKQSNFTRAAEKLFVSQSTLSKSIRAVEREVEMELINRQAKEFALTPEGQIFYDYAQRILDFYDEQTTALYERLRRTPGSLHLGMPPTAGTIYFFPLLYDYRKLYPAVDLKITEMTSKSVQQLVHEGTLDIGVVIEPFFDDKMVTQTVYTSEAVLVVSKDHPLANRRSVDSADLAQEQFLMVSRDYMYYDVVIDHCKAAGYTPNITFESSQWDLILEMVAAGQGISILPKPLVDKLYSKRVRQIHLKNPTFPWALTLVYRRDKVLTGPMKDFLALCEEGGGR